MKLVIRQSDKAAETRQSQFETSKESITIGRDPSSDLHLPLSTVSRRHARIVKHGADCFIEDLHSSCGTTLNGKPIEAGKPKLLREGDTIGIAKMELVFFPYAQAGGTSEATCFLAARFAREMLGGGAECLPRLRVVMGCAAGKQLSIASEGGPLSVGRSDKCDLVLWDHGVSRLHVKVTRCAESVFIEDAESKNGISLNGRIVAGRALLKDGDELVLGKAVLVFVDPAEALIRSVSTSVTRRDEAPERGGIARPQTRGPSPKLRNRAMFLAASLLLSLAGLAAAVITLFV